MKKEYRKSYRKKKKTPFYENRALNGVIGTTILLFLTGYFFLFFDFFWVENIEISGNQEIEGRELEDLIKKNTLKSFFFLSTKSIFLFNSNTVEEKIITEFPAILNLEIKKDYPNKIILKIREREPIGSLCSTECFLIDSRGIILREAKEKQPPIIIIRENKYSVGAKVIGENEVHLILEIWDNLADRIGISEFQVEENKLNVLTKEGWTCLFNLEEDLYLQMAKLLAVLEEKISPERRKDLDYIDLRFERRAYFKYRD